MSFRDQEKRVFVHLSYLDDGGKGDVRIFGGIVFDHRSFHSLESAVGSVVRLIPEEKRESFTRFHAADLYLGTKEFQGIPDAERYQALLELVRIPYGISADYIYSAVDVRKLKASPMRSSDWMDVAFNLVAMTVNDVVREKLTTAAITAQDELARLLLEAPLLLMIVDECDKDTKGKIRNSFRLMRHHFTLPGIYAWASNRLFHSMDDIFFGSSADSLGLQVADACNYVMWRHLDEGVDDIFYRELMRSKVFCSRPQPQWEQYKHLLRAHDEPSGYPNGWPVSS